MKNSVFILFTFFIISSCGDRFQTGTGPYELTIFFVNDQHGEISNFSKIKHIIDQEKENTKVLVSCAGDMFSGNPIVDIYPEKGYPMIDIMNRVGFDIAVLGNHEFDYGEEALQARIEQSEFAWICANVDMSNSVIDQPMAYKTFELDQFKVTFLGLVETNGKGDIPLTHPWKIQDVNFFRPETVVEEYELVKQDEDSDIYIALTHLGHVAPDYAISDVDLAEQYPFFDLIIGGHTNAILAEEINGIPVFQAGNNLNYLGKVQLVVNDKSIESYSYEHIELNSYNQYDESLKAIIDDYNNSMPDLDEVIGYSHTFHERWQVGCFYTDALKGQMNVQVSFQNSGGVRSFLDEGEISKREIYEIDPFNNGTMNYTMSVEEIKTFLKEAGGGYYYSGIQIEQNGTEVEIKNEEGFSIPNEDVLTVGINDFIPAVNPIYFPVNVTPNEITTAETIIAFLEEGDGQVDYPNCTRFFRYQ